ncbi:MAG: hypothetical protein ACR2LX_15250 [Jatrophihabitans sp.]
MNETTWFRRFADIPGIEYTTTPGLDLRHLRKRGLTPEVHDYGSGGSLWWETEHGGTSQSPAGEHMLDDRQAATPAQIRTNVAEALELPGTPSDYHFALQNAASELYGRRRSDPTTIDDAHRLYLLDLDLIQLHPEAVTIGLDGPRTYVSILGLSRLMRMYLNEGRVADAAAIATIAERFEAGDSRDAVAARTRAAALAAEDVS